MIMLKIKVCDFVKFTSQHQNILDYQDRHKLK